MKHLKSVIAAAVALAACAVHAGPVITGTSSSATLATTIAGAGITINSSSLSYQGTMTPYAAGTFTGGASTVGFDSGIVLTTGDIACATGANTSDSCSLDRQGVGNSGVSGTVYDKTTLNLNFSSATGNIFFQYVFASEEYNEFANSQYNDGFKLLLDGTNIAKIGTQDVTINNVNCTTNNAFYRNNKVDNVPGCTAPFLNLDIQYDGLTVVLTASGFVGAGNHDFEFTVFDVSDGIYDSGVFIKAGSFSGVNPVPEPGTLALVGLALLGATAARRKA